MLIGQYCILCCGTIYLFHPIRFNLFYFTPIKTIPSCNKNYNWSVFLIKGKCHEAVKEEQSLRVIPTASRTVDGGFVNIYLSVPSSIKFSSFFHSFSETLSLIHPIQTQVHVHSPTFSMCGDSSHLQHMNFNVRTCIHHW